ncbi:Dihydroneopterin aldolase/epimerase domain [Arabidopsis suecica]|uniref:7,8-dihydroneopterin aldolase n=1 Tax=Arabidopsis suecica TaxID=45249 RepID=A0A8T2BA62_ARASU|nr:Dihydroneopterin aldolase/epimerase domain [Arabidopsis suecica]
MHSSLKTTAPATLERLCILLFFLFCATFCTTESLEPLHEDKLILRGLKFYGFHGVLPEEKKLGDLFTVDIDLWLSLKKAIESDNLADTVSFADTFSLVKKIVEGPPKNLYETVAEHIASKMLETFPKINVIRVKLGKRNPSLVNSTVDYLAAELFRKRKH